MRHQHERAAIGVEGRFQLLDGGQVEVVRWFVQHQEVHAAGGEAGQLGPRALARGKRRRRAGHGLGAQTELGQLGPGQIGPEAGGGRVERIEEGACVAQEAPVLAQLAHDHARSNAPGTGGQGEPPEDGFDQGRLAGAVGPDQGDAVGPVDVERERTETEVLALDHRLLETDDDRTRPDCLVDAELELPSLPRFVHHLERGQGALGAPCS